MSVISLGYPGNRSRFANGQFIRYGDEGSYSGSALFELFDGDDRLALDHGASGAPVLDCDGRVVGVVSNIFTKTISFIAGHPRVDGLGKSECTCHSCLGP